MFLFRVIDVLDILIFIFTGVLIIPVAEYFRQRLLRKHGENQKISVRSTIAHYVLTYAITAVVIYFYYINHRDSIDQEFGGAQNAIIAFYCEHIPCGQRSEPETRRPSPPKQAEVPAPSAPPKQPETPAPSAPPKQPETPAPSVPPKQPEARPSVQVTPPANKYPDTSRNSGAPGSRMPSPKQEATKETPGQIRDQVKTWSAESIALSNKGRCTAAGRIVRRIGDLVLSSGVNVRLGQPHTPIEQEILNSMLNTLRAEHDCELYENADLDAKCQKEADAAGLRATDQWTTYISKCRKELKKTAP